MWGGVGGRRPSEFLNGICFFNDNEFQQDMIFSLDLQKI